MDLNIWILLAGKLSFIIVYLCLQSHDKNRDVLRCLRSHVILSLFHEPDSPEVGLFNFVMPLRSSSFRREDLKTVILVGDEKFLRKEWPALATFPEVYVRPVSLQTTYMWLVLSAAFILHVSSFALMFVLSAST